MSNEKEDAEKLAGARKLFAGECEFIWGTGDINSLPPMGLPEIAFVGDNSFAAYTSPVAGQRYRLSYSPTIGNISFQTLLADYRRYFFIRPTM